MKPIIKVDNLCFGYGSRQKIFDGLSFEVMPNDFLAVAGPNGAGKTTLLNLLCGLLRADAGYVESLETWQAQGIKCHKLIRDQEPIYVLWQDQGTQTIDFSQELSGQIKVSDGQGASEVINSSSLEIGLEPVFVEAND